MLICISSPIVAHMQSAMQADHDVDMSSIQLTMGVCNKYWNTMAVLLVIIVFGFSLTDVGVKVDSASTHAFVNFSDAGQCASLRNNLEHCNSNSRFSVSFDTPGNVDIPTTCSEMESSKHVIITVIEMFYTPIYKISISFCLWNLS